MENKINITEDDTKGHLLRPEDDDATSGLRAPQDDEVRAPHVDDADDVEGHLRAP